LHRPCRIHFLVALCVSLFLGPSANPQTLKPNWTRKFPNPVSWYVRTSAGILLVKSARSLTALDAKSGNELWALADVRLGSTSFADVPGAENRGLNVLEVPAMGVLLLNGARWPSSSEPRMIALNLMTGERLWEAPPVDEMMTVIPLYESGQAVVVSRRMQKKIYAAEVAGVAMTGEFVGPALLSMLPFPYRFELERLDLATGKVQWNEEYPRTFGPGATSVRAFGDSLFIYFNNHFLGCMDLASGKVRWEEGAKGLSVGTFPLPLQMTDGRLIYGSKDVVEALDPETQKVAWTSEDLGKVTGLFVDDGLAVALGEKRIAAVDASTGAERWRKKTDGHTTNLLWDKATDALLYMDWKGLHRVERTTGKSLLDAKLQTNTPPHYLRMAGPKAVVAIGYNETEGYDTENGKLLFTEANLSGLYRADAVLDSWPLPEDGQGLVRMVSSPTGDEEWESLRRRTLLPATLLQRMQQDGGREDDLLDVYQTEPEKGPPKIWWVDGPTNRQMVIRPAAQKHDVSRAIGNVFAVDGKMLWAARIEGY
jgi:outer membrane protein assembly factor BamB